MAGKNESKVVEVLNHLGFVEGVDYVRQHPFAERFVFDFAFVKLRIAIEVDGKNHNCKKQRKKDKARDRFLYSNGWVCVRVDDKDFFDNFKMSYYKSLIKYVVDERAEQYQNGFLYPIEISKFNEQDYE